MLLIGFGGIAQAGKSTAARHLAGMLYHNNWTPKRMCVAWRLKQATERLNISKDKEPEKYRAFCQKYGALRRDVSFRPGVSGPNYWVRRLNKLLIRSGSLENSRHVVILDDLRYQSELDFVRSLGGTLVYVDALRRFEDQLHLPWRQHESEQLAIQYGKGFLPDNLFDFIISNNGSEASFEKKALSLATKIGPYVDT